MMLVYELITLMYIIMSVFVSVAASVFSSVGWASVFISVGPDPPGKNSVGSMPFHQRLIVNSETNHFSFSFVAQSSLL